VHARRIVAVVATLLGALAAAAVNGGFGWGP